MTWYEQAEARLKDEYGKVKRQKVGVMKSAVRDALLGFGRENVEFAQAGPVASPTTAMAARVATEEAAMLTMLVPLSTVHSALS